MLQMRERKLLPIVDPRTRSPVQFSSSQHVNPLSISASENSQSPTPTATKPQHQGLHEVTHQVSSAAAMQRAPATSQPATSAVVPSVKAVASAADADSPWLRAASVALSGLSQQQQTAGYQSQLSVVKVVPRPQSTHSQTASTGDAEHPASEAHAALQSVLIKSTNTKKARVSQAAALHLLSCPCYTTTSSKLADAITKIPRLGSMKALGIYETFKQVLLDDGRFDFKKGPTRREEFVVLNVQQVLQQAAQASNSSSSSSSKLTNIVEFGTASQSLGAAAAAAAASGSPWAGASSSSSSSSASAWDQAFASSSYGSSSSSSTAWDAGSYGSSSSSNRSSSIQSMADILRGSHQSGTAGSSQLTSRLAAGTAAAGCGNTAATKSLWLQAVTAGLPENKHPQQQKQQQQVTAVQGHVQAVPTASDNPTPAVASTSITTALGSPPAVAAAGDSRAAAVRAAKMLWPPRSAFKETRIHCAAALHLLECQDCMSTSSGLAMAVSRAPGLGSMKTLRLHKTFKQVLKEEPQIFKFQEGPTKHEDLIVLDVQQLQLTQAAQAGSSSSSSNLLSTPSLQQVVPSSSSSSSSSSSVILTQQALLSSSNANPTIVGTYSCSSSGSCAQADHTVMGGPCSSTTASQGSSINGSSSDDLLNLLLEDDALQSASNESASVIPAAPTAPAAIDEVFQANSAVESHTPPEVWTAAYSLFEAAALGLMPPPLQV